MSESTEPGERDMKLLQSTSRKWAGKQEGVEVVVSPRYQWVIQSVLSLSFQVLHKSHTSLHHKVNRNGVQHNTSVLLHRSGER